MKNRKGKGEIFPSSREREKKGVDEAGTSFTREKQNQNSLRITDFYC